LIFFSTMRKLFFAALLSVACGGSIAQAQNGNLGSAINSEHDDYAARLSETNDTIWFSSSRPVNGKVWKARNSELFYASGVSTIRCEPLEFDSPELFDNVTKHGETLQINPGAMTVSRDRKFAIIAAERVTAEGGQSAYHDLYQVTLDANGRPNSPLMRLSTVNLPDSWESQPALSIYDDALYFVSDRKVDGDDKGDFDIYVSKRERNGQWGAPIKLGANINTDGDEVSPFVGRDGYFYYSSDGNPDKKTPTGEQGKRDIFKAQWQGPDLFGTLERLPAPYNSSGNDEFPYISNNGRLFLLTSDREGGEGNRDIYAYCQYTPPTIALEGAITQRSEEDPNPANSQPFERELFLQDLTTNQLSVVRTNTEGKYRVVLKPEHRYRLTLDTLPCFRNPIGAEISAVIPEADTTHIRNFEYLSIRQAIGLRTDTVVPFFVTGYWYPNTTSNYQKLLSEKEKLNKSWFIHPVWKNESEPDESGNVNYRETSQIVTNILDRAIYKPVQKLLAKMMSTPCNDSGLVLKIAVTGFTDERRLMDGPYTDEAVTVDGVRIEPGTIMNKDGYVSPGNAHLSKLRSYFTLLTLDRDLAAMSPEYATLKRQNRIVFECSGNGVDAKGSTKAFKRRVDIQVSLIQSQDAIPVRQKFPFVNQRLTSK
jgi:hypothetical protein